MTQWDMFILWGVLIDRNHCCGPKLEKRQPRNSNSVDYIQFDCFHSMYLLFLLSRLRFVRVSKVIQGLNRRNSNNMSYQAALVFAMINFYRVVLPSMHRLEVEFYNPSLCLFNDMISKISKHGFYFFFFFFKKKQLPQLHIIINWVFIISASYDRCANTLALNLYECTNNRS